jgi:hypothetical protein
MCPIRTRGIQQRRYGDSPRHTDFPIESFHREQRRWGQLSIAAPRGRGSSPVAPSTHEREIARRIILAAPGTTPRRCMIFDYWGDPCCGRQCRTPGRLGYRLPALPPSKGCAPSLGRSPPGFPPALADNSSNARVSGSCPFSLLSMADSFGYFSVGYSPRF